MAKQVWALIIQINIFEREQKNDKHNFQWEYAFVFFVKECILPECAIISHSTNFSKKKINNRNHIINPRYLC